MPNQHGDGIWVIYQGTRYGLSGISLENFKSFKEQLPERKLKKMPCSIWKDGKHIEVTLDELELADPQ